MDKTIIARGPAEMEEIGVELAESLSDGTLVSLAGSLGAGKTTLAKGIAKGLLITDVVVSPSYLLARVYYGKLPLYHIDAEVGLDVYLPPEHGVSVVEWPERIDGLVDISDVLVRIEFHESGGRRVDITQR
jgi:tRNA threonylcarbamoyladenosine biosynthesis protein TsaE